MQSRQLLRLISPCQPRLVRTALTQAKSVSTSSAETSFAAVSSLGPVQRLAYANDLIKEGHGSMFMKVDVVEQIVDSLAQDFQWNILGPLSRSKIVLDILRRTNSYSLDPIMNIMLQGLRAREQVEVEDVEAVLHVSSFTTSLGKSASQNFIKAEAILLSQVPNINDVDRLLRLLTTLATKLRGVTPDPALARAVMHRLTVLIPQSNLFEDKNLTKSTCEALRAINEMGVRDELFMEAISSAFQRSDLGTMKAVGARMLVHFFSRLCFPATAVFDRLTPTLQLMSATSHNSVNDVIVCWSYLAQGLDPPEKSMEAICVGLATKLRAEPRYIVHGVEELQQLKPYLPFEVDGLEGCIRRSYAARYTIPLRMVSQVQVYHPQVAVGQHRPEGFVPLAALVEPDSGELLAWPSDCGPMDLDAESAPRLPGVPVALLIENRESCFAEPEGMLDGMLEMKCRLLKRSGWAVTVQFVQQLADDHSCGKDYMAACVEALQRAAAAHDEAPHAADDDYDGA